MSLTVANRCIFLGFHRLTDVYKIQSDVADETRLHRASAAIQDCLNQYKGALYKMPITPDENEGLFWLVIVFPPISVLPRPCVKDLRCDLVERLDGKCPGLLAKATKPAQLKSFQIASAKNFKIMKVEEFLEKKKIKRRPSTERAADKLVKQAMCAA